MKRRMLGEKRTTFSSNRVDTEETTLIYPKFQMKVLPKINLGNKIPNLQDSQPKIKKIKVLNSSRNKTMELVDPGISTHLVSTNQSLDTLTPSKQDQQQDITSNNQDRLEKDLVPWDKSELQHKEISTAIDENFLNQ